jgi:transcriptional regulator with XRE-family HTH domain
LSKKDAIRSIYFLFLKQIALNMIKQKLINKRKERNFTQEEFAFKLGIETSNYNRRENGITKISKNEWDKMAKLLDTTLEEIYEPEDGVYIIKSEITNPPTLNEFAFETMKKYIQKLEEEIELLRKRFNP